MMDRQLIKHVAVFWAFGLSLVTIGIWFLAFGNGGRALIRIDTYGEKYPELVLWAIVVPILTVGLHYYVTDEFSE